MCQYSNKILKQFNTAKVLLPKFDKYHKFAVTVMCMSYILAMEV